MDGSDVKKTETDLKNIHVGVQWDFCLDHLKQLLMINLLFDSDV